MNLKPKRFCFGVVVICTIAIVAFHSGACEPGDLTRPFEQSVLTAAMLKARRQRLGSRLRLSNSNTQSMKPVDLGETSKSGMSSLGPDQYQNNPSDNFKTNCNKGEIKHITQGRFDFYPDTQEEVRGDVQPVVSCAEASMTLTAPRRWAAQLQLGTGKDVSFLLPKLPPHCGYSMHKSWRDVSLSVQYNGCHVMQERAHYVLPLLWRRTPVKISCPVSRIKPQALDGLSLCCASRGITIRIQGPSAAKELNVNVRGEWTPLLELVQHCGYSMDRTNAETVITAPFLACGITSRDGDRGLSLQIGEEVFALTCYQSTAEVLQHQSLQPTTSAKPTPTYETPKPFQWARPFYLAPPHFPHPAHRHKTRVYASTPLTPTAASFETPQKDDQQNKHMRPFEEYYREKVSQRGLVKVFPHLKHTSGLTHSPTEATGFGPTLMPHNYAFNPFYHFYHHPKIPPTNQPSVTGFVVKLNKQSEVTEKMPMYHLNLAPDSPNPSDPMPLNSFFHHYLTRTNFGDFQNPARSTLASPLPALATQIRGGHILETKDFAPVAPPVDHMHSSTNRHSPYGSPMYPNTPIYPYHHLPQDFYQLYHLYHGLQGENSPTPASFPQTPNSIPPSEDPKDSSGSHFQPELPVPFKPGNDRAEGLNNEGESAAHSDPSYDSSSWEKWFNLAAKVNSVPEPLYMLPPPAPVPEERTREEASVEGHIDASQPFASPCCSGTGSRFHSSLSPRCFSFPVKDCISGEYFVFSLPELVVEPKVVGVGQDEESCALKRLTSNPYVYFVPLHGCGVTKEAIDAWVIYQLQLETCDSDNSLIRMLVECSSYPGLPSAETLHILDPLPLQYPVPLQLRIATDESYSYHPEAHLPLSRVRGRMLLMELGLLQPPDPSVALRVHYCLAYTLPPSASAMLIYDGCLSGSESQLLPSLSSNIQYIVVNSFLSLTSSPSIVHDADPEVYFFCLTEVCSAFDGTCSAACIKSSE